MKGLIVLSAAFIIGCAPTKTLEELELAALKSGDWSAVERRERAIAKRRARAAYSCSDGYVLVCMGRTRQGRCHCSSQDNVRDMLSGL